MIYEKLQSPSLFLKPKYITHPTNWVGHIPFTFWLIEKLKPKQLVELGSHFGNSYFSFCQAIVELGLEADCYAVDTWEGDPQAGYYGDEVFKLVQTYNKRLYNDISTLLRSTFDEAVHHFDNNSIDLLHIDGLHSYEAVKHDFESWRSKVNDQRGIVLFHDTSVKHGDFGVWKLWEELTSEYPHFTLDHSYGLGVLGLGTQIPDTVSWLFELTKNTEEHQLVKNFFQNAGLELMCFYDGIRHITYGRKKPEEEDTGRNLVEVETGKDGFRSSFLAIQNEYLGLVNKNVMLSQQNAELLKVKNNLSEECRALRDSTSWKLTKPLRAIAEKIK